MKIKLAIMTILFFISNAIWAGGFVGNGAGIVEQNIQFAYTALTKFLDLCASNQKICELNQYEQVLVKKIDLIVKNNISNKDRISFISEKERPGFFSTSDTEHHRIAKTGLTPNHPIYFNLDQLYSKDGKALLDLKSIVGILVHEVGHQTGEPDHRLLDILASKISSVVELQSLINEFKFESGELIKISLINYADLFSISDFLIEMGFEKNPVSLKYTRTVYDSLNCPSGGKPVGTKLYNGHWFNVKSELQKNNAIGFGIWIRLTCLGEFNTIDNKIFEAKYIFNKNSITPVHVQLSEL